MVRLFFIFSVFIFGEGDTSSILLHTKDAIVWHPEQRITGELSGFTAEKVIVHHNQFSFSVDITDDRKFSFELILQDEENKIWLTVPGDPAIVSDTLHYRLGYDPAPIVKPFATVADNKAILHATTIENPYQVSLQYLWLPDSLNPALCQIIKKEDSIATVEIPDIPGIYNFNLLVIAEDDSSWFQTFVKRDEQGIHPFKIDSGYPSWMDEIILYQITPYSFVKNGTFDAITAKLQEIKDLGINTIWLQPVFKSFYGGQGYDVTGYFSLNPNLGTEKQLQHLIATAKALGMRVLFDVVLNHTSIHHPYARDRIKYGAQSHYYNFYQHENDGKPYSSFYNSDEYGFINYFWDDLVNLNYQNKEVQRWMLEVSKYWVRKFDIDGYRFDAIWGVNARMPSFAKRLRMELKSIKPDVLLLAEDKGSVPKIFELGFDAAYDWTADTNWVSQSSWEYDYDENISKTIFNFPDVDKRGNMMRQALFQNGGNAHRKLRYMENNDLPRFIKVHQLERTKMVAALLFALPGIPMLYNGQEVGSRGHPYSTSAVFNRNWSIQAVDPAGLFSYYQKLIQLHKQYPALSGTAMKELSVSPEEAIVAFHRWKKDENFIIVINMDSVSTDANIDLSKVLPDVSSLEDFWLRDILSDNFYHMKGDSFQVKIPIGGYTVRWLLLEKEGEVTGAAEEPGKENLVIYPNPSNGNITINFPDLSFNNVRIFNMLGMTVFEEKIGFPSSKRSLSIHLPSKAYFLEITSKKEILTTKILIQ